MEPNPLQTLHWVFFIISGFIEALNTTEVDNLEINLNLEQERTILHNESDRQSETNNETINHLRIITDRNIISQNNIYNSSREQQGNSESKTSFSEQMDSSDESEEKSLSRTPPCPVGFIRHKNSCYHIIGSSELSWSIANTYCQLHGSKLVEIESESEQRFIESMIQAAKGNLFVFVLLYQHMNYTNKIEKVTKGWGHMGHMVQWYCSTHYSKTFQKSGNSDANSQTLKPMPKHKPTVKSQMHNLVTRIFGGVFAVQPAAPLWIPSLWIIALVYELSIQKLVVFK